MNNLMKVIRNSSICKKVFYRCSEENHINICNLLKKKHYYIIRRPAPGGGFFSNYIWVITHLSYALKHNYIPVVDQLNYKTEYTEQEPVNGTENVWEYYFHQPFNMSLDRAYDSKNYILSDYEAHSEELPYTENNIKEFLIDSKKLDMVHNIASKYIVLREEIQAELDNKWNGMLKNRSRKQIIGVHVRGTDKQVSLQGHYLAPGLIPYIQAVDKLLEKYPEASIFLCCDEKKTIKFFCEIYTDRVRFNKVYRAEDNSKIDINLEKNNNIRPFHKYQLGLEVIYDAYMLARCSCLVHTHSNVTNAAIILNGGKYTDRILVEAQ